MFLKRIYGQLDFKKQGRMLAFEKHEIVQRNGEGKIVKVSLNSKNSVA